MHYPVKWITKILKDTTTKVLTYIKDAEHILFFINKIGKFDKNKFFYAADTTAMCPKIDTEEGLEALLISYETNLVKCTKNIPIKQLIIDLHLLMKHNVFLFGTT